MFFDDISMKNIFYFFIIFWSAIAYFSSCEKGDELGDFGPKPIHDTILIVDTVHSTDYKLLYDTIYIKDTIVQKEHVVVVDTFYIREVVIYNDTILRVDTICMKDTVYIHENPNIKPGYIYPSSKIWYHGANDPSVAAEKSMKFEGLEFDINYSSSTGNLYVCHNIEDTIKCITIEQWFEALPDPTKNWFWIDFKNLSILNADEASEKIDIVAQKYGIKDRIWIENFDVSSVQMVKEHGFNTILTIDNFFAQTYSEFLWHYYALGKITAVGPSAIGCDHTMATLLNNYFSDLEIFLWHSTLVYTDEYAEQTRALCRIPSVKVVLVDYDDPITY